MREVLVNRKYIVEENTFGANVYDFDNIYIGGLQLLYKHYGLVFQVDEGKTVTQYHETREERYKEGKQ